MESLQYEEGIINLNGDLKAKIEDVVIVKEKIDQTPQVLRVGGGSIAIIDFEPSTASFAVCPIWKDGEYSEEVIQGKL